MYKSLQTRLVVELTNRGSYALVIALVSRGAL